MSTLDTLAGYADAATQMVNGDSEVEYAYRERGEGDVPLVLLQHFRGNLDNWDPALIDALAADRRVVTFDNLGVGATTGRTPATVEAMPTERSPFSRRWSFRESICSASRLAASSRRRSRSSVPTCCGVSCSPHPHHRAQRGCTAGRQRSSARSARRRRPRRDTSPSS